MKATKHPPGPWNICPWNDGKSFTVWRRIVAAGPNGTDLIERITNAAGNRKRFRSASAARAAIAKADSSSSA